MNEWRVHLQLPITSDHAINRCNPFVSAFCKRQREGWSCLHGFYPIWQMNFWPITHDIVNVFVVMAASKHRVVIASAIASEHAVIIFDEPTSGLDLRHMHEVSDNLTDLRRMGKTTLIITHGLELILKCCTHALYLDVKNFSDSYPLDMEGIAKNKRFFLEHSHHEGEW
jgi:hypothetical protein